MKVGQKLVKEGRSHDDNIYIIIAGKLSILRKGENIGQLGIGESVGEEILFCINPSQAYSYTAAAVEHTYCLECLTIQNGEGLQVKEEMIKKGYRKDWENIEKNLLYSYYQKERWGAFD